MGICQSCLGNRDKDVYEEQNEGARLLYDDGNGIPYGSFSDSALNGDGDIAEVQRESEALQRVLAKTNNNMVDIFEIAPLDSSGQNSSTSNLPAGQNARAARYHHLISKLSAGGRNAPAGVKVDWLADGDLATGNTEPPVSLRTLDGEGVALVGTFADAAAAMQ